MPLDVVYGETRNRAVASQLAEVLSGALESGTIYLGYPVLATADERVDVDALLVSQPHGLVAFLIGDGLPATDEEWKQIIEEQDRLYTVLESHLGRHESLRRRRSLAIEPHTATVFASPPDRRVEAEDGFYGSIDEVPEWVSSLPSIDAEVEKAVQAALQRVTTIKPAKKRAGVAKPASRGAKLKEIERGIANLDRFQKRAAIESPEGPQRIRGLAGSGKTVVLALKAAYLHTQHPEWQIALTFSSRALYQQITDLVTRFTFEHSNDKPDPEHLRIVHSWGSRARHGVYSLIAVALGETPRDWNYANAKYGQDNAFAGICRELLEVAATRTVEPIFNAVLIDEAQDLPAEFFRLVYRFTHEPKRIVWAYDELQKLSESAMPDTDELFGRGPAGESLVSLDAPEGAPRRDIVLPVCYRNTPWALATAHAIGIGVYRPAGLLQHPDEPHLWEDIGYEVVHGRLEAGSRVTLRRSTVSYPGYFDTLLTPSDAVVLRTFGNEAAQDAWVAEQVATNLTEDELEPDDILIVLPDSYRAKSRAPGLIRALGRYNILGHLVGVNTSADEVFQQGSVAIAHIYRAKGNEAPMVYAIDTQLAAPEFNAVTRRNKLFTAITRSRAWIRITGWGDNMAGVGGEIEAVIREQFRLTFQVPTREELAALRHLHRDRPPEHEEVIRRAREGIAAFVDAYERGEIDLMDLPADLRTRLFAHIREGQGSADG